MCQTGSGPRREQRKNARRQHILAVATASFLTRGYAGTKMSDIAAEIGGSKSTLWAYFPSKEILFGEALKEAGAIIQVQLENALGGDGAATDNLHAFAEMFVAKLTSAPVIALQRLIVSEAARFPEIGRVFHDYAFLPMHLHVKAYLAREMASGRMRPADPAQAAFELMGLLQRPQQFLLWNMPEIDGSMNASGYAHAAIDTFIRAYGIAPLEAS